MNLTISEPTLANALSIAGRAASPRSALPVLANVRLEAVNGSLRLDATNLETGITIWTPAAVAEPGATTLPARTLTEIVSTLAGDVTLALNKRTQATTVSAGSSKTNLKGIDAAEFPPMPEMPAEVALTLPAADLRSALTQVVFAASSDDGRPVLTGVYFDASGPILTLAAADGFRLAVCKLGVSAATPFTAIVPARALETLAKIMPQAGDVQIALPPGRGQILFRSGDVQLVSQLIDAAFPDYRRLIPTRVDTRLIVDTTAFARAVKQAEIFSCEDAHLCRLNVTPEALEVSGQSAETGDNLTTVPAQVDGPPLEIALNAAYLQDCLAACRTPQAIIDFTDSTRPAVVRPLNGADLLIVIMPMHLGD